MESGGDGGGVPEIANEHCPGTQSETAGKAEACAGCPNQQICATAPKGPDPGMSDEYISIVQYLQIAGIDGAIIVTTPQQVSLIDVRKEINFCKKVGVPVLGVVENMIGLRQASSDLRFVKQSETGETDATEWALNYIKEKAPDLLSVIACSEVFDSSKGGAEKMCHEMGVPFLGKVPMDPQLCKAAEEGRSCFTDQKCSASAPALKQIIKKLIKTQ